jgi:hypothetical protein
MTMTPRILTLVSLLLSATGGASRAQENGLGWIDWALVDAGEVVYQTERVERGTVRIDVAISIDADREKIWDLLTACEISPEFVPHVVDCRRIATIEDCECDLFEQTVKPAFFLPSFDHVFRLAYFPPNRIEVRHVSGPIDRMEGAWQLIERPGKTLTLVHTMTLKPGFPVPPLFVRNTLRKDLPKVLEELRSRAEVSPLD